MKNNSIDKKSFLIDAMIIIGFIMILLGSCLLFSTVRGQSVSRIVFPFCMITVGTFSLLVFFWLRHTMIFFGFGIAMIPIGFLLLLVSVGVIPFLYNQVWPLNIVFIAAALFISGCIHFKRLHPASAIPSVILCLMGIVFFLFSANIVTISLRSFVALWWPLFFVVGGFLLLLIFFEIKRNSL